MMANVLVTGATGFIGAHLVRQLTTEGHQVTCLVRPTSNRTALEAFDPEFVVGDLTDESAVRQATLDKDWVINLAGTTKALRKSDFERANVVGARVVAKACSEMIKTPLLIHISSLAAAGPNHPSTHASAIPDQS